MIQENNKPVSINEFAYEQIKRNISNGVYEPGMKLQTQNIADELNISRTPVVVAINRIAAEGYATSIPQQGVFVRKFTYRSLHDIFELRRMIELYTVDTIIQNLKFDRSALDILWKYADAYKELESEDVSYDKARDVECDFHHTLIGLSGNDEILKAYKQSLCVESCYIMYHMANMPLTTVVPHYKEHANIVRLIESGEEADLRALLEKHIRTPIEMLDWLAKNGRLKME